MSKNYFREWEQYKRKNPDGEFGSYSDYANFRLWKEYNAWQNKNEADIRVIKTKDGREVSQKIKNFDEFKSILREAKGDIQRIKDEVRFETSAGSARAFMKSYKDIKGESLDLSVREARKMTTRQLAALMNDDIKGFRETQIDELMKQGLSSADARRMASLMVSHYFFGS